MSVPMQALFIFGVVVKTLLSKMDLDGEMISTTQPSGQNCVVTSQIKTLRWLVMISNVMSA